MNVRETGPRVSGQVASKLGTTTAGHSPRSRWCDSLAVRFFVFFHAFVVDPLRLSPLAEVIAPRFYPFR